MDVRKVNKLFITSNFNCKGKVIHNYRIFLFFLCLCTIKGELCAGKEALVVPRI